MKTLIVVIVYTTKKLSLLSGNLHGILKTGSWVYVENNILEIGVISLYFSLGKRHTYVL